MVKLFFRGSREKWRLGIERAKMVTTDGPSIHLQKASKLSRQWGPLQALNVSGFTRRGILRNEQQHLYEKITGGSRVCS
jgi:hypothetical protein